VGFINYIHSRAYARLRSHNQVLPDAVDLELCDTDTEHVQPGSVVERVEIIFWACHTELSLIQIQKMVGPPGGQNKATCRPPGRRTRAWLT